MASTTKNTECSTLDKKVPAILSKRTKDILEDYKRAKRLSMGILIQVVAAIDAVITGKPANDYNPDNKIIIQSNP